MDIIQGKLDSIIELLEELVDNRNIETDSSSYSLDGEEDEGINDNEDEDEDKDEDEEQIVQYNSILIGKLHRLIEIKNDRTNEINLHIQYLDGDNWVSKHVF